MQDFDKDFQSKLTWTMYSIMDILSHVQNVNTMSSLEICTLFQGLSKVIIFLYNKWF